MSCKNVQDIGNGHTGMMVCRPCSCWLKEHFRKKKFLGWELTFQNRQATPKYLSQACYQLQTLHVLINDPDCSRTPGGDVKGLPLWLGSLMLFISDCWNWKSAIFTVHYLQVSFPFRCNCSPSRVLLWQTHTGTTWHTISFFCSQQHFCECKQCLRLHRLQLSLLNPGFSAAKKKNLPHTLTMKNKTGNSNWVARH